MKPYPLSALNHLTVPVATVAIPLLALDVHRGLPNRAVMPCEALSPAAKLPVGNAAVSSCLFGGRECPALCPPPANRGRPSGRGGRRRRRSRGRHGPGRA